MDGKLCELSGDPAAEGVGAWRAGRISFLLGGGMVYFPTLEVARLSCLCRLNGSMGDFCGLGLGVLDGNMASSGTRSLIGGRAVLELARVLSSGIRSRAVLATKLCLEDVSVVRVRLSSSDSSESAISISSPACRAMSGLLGSMKPIKTASPNEDWGFLRRRWRLGELPLELVGLVDELCRLPSDNARSDFSCKNGGIELSGP